MNDTEFRAAFHAHKNGIYRFAWRMTGSPEAAEDVAQETFLTLLRQPGRFDPSRGELRAFLFGVARNLALKRYREEHRWESIEDGQWIGEPIDPAAVDASAQVAAAVASLPPLQREALILAEYEA